MINIIERKIKIRDLLILLLMEIIVILTGVWGLYTINDWSYQTVLVPVILVFFISMFLYINSLFLDKKSGLGNTFFHLLYLTIFLVFVVLSSISQFVRGQMMGITQNIDIFLRFSIIPFFLSIIFTGAIEEKKMSEKDIFEGVKNCSYPASLAALSLVAAQFLNESAKVLITYSAVLFLISSISILFHSWYSSANIDKNESILGLSRTFSVGFLLFGLLLLLVSFTR
ncbi:MAG: hypothetical protein JW754_02120 [Candidatus Aenigmarchaeota archaeon]|nr:hypothetical protein [Candidatus Aenigmarchaeota archaeon]